MESYGNRSICVPGVMTSLYYSCGAYINGSIVPLCVEHEIYNVNGNNKSVVYLDGMLMKQ